MDTTLRVPRVRLLMQLLLLWLASVTSAWAGIGPQIVQNGRFAIHPEVNGTAYSIAAGTDLGNWRSGRPYVNTNTYPARGSVNIQTAATGAVYTTTGTHTTGFVNQRTYSNFNPASASNPVTSTTTVNTFLLYRGTNASADIWFQNVSTLPSTTYTVTYFASNAAPVGSTSTAPQLQMKATFMNGNTAVGPSLLTETGAAATTITIPNETVGTGDVWTQYSYTFTTAANTSNVELRLTDPVVTPTGDFATNSNQVAVTAIVVRAVSNAAGTTAISAGTAFSCNGAFYQIRQADNTPINTFAGNSTRLYLVDRSAATYTTTQLQELGATVNGLSYDPNNGYIYAITYRGNEVNSTTNDPGEDRIAETSSFIEVVKIGQGGVESIGFAPNLPVAQWAAGAIDRGLNLYIKEQQAGNIMYKLDLNSFPIAVTPITLTSNITIFDMAYDPISGLLYGSDYPGSLERIDPNTGTVTTIASAITAYDPLGSFFFDVAGNLYAYGNGPITPVASINNPGNFYYINKATGAATTLAGTVGRSTNSDGASCINPSEQIDVVKQLTNVALVSGNTNQRDVTFRLYLRNTGTVTLPNVQVSDFLWTSGSTANSQNVAFPAATAAVLVGTITVNNLNGSSLTANAAFTGQGTANGAGAITASNLAALLNTSTAQVLTAGQSVEITYTIRLTFGTVPSAVQYNTAYASNSTSTNPGSRQLTSGGTVLPPDDLTAYDLSTNGTTYAPTRITGPVDSPVPTPVVFFPAITGTVFEDVNYGGGAGRSLATSGGVGRPNVRVELYTSGGTYTSTTTTDANGNYAFTNLTAGTTYNVRVVNGDVTSSRLGAVSTLLPVQTYRYNDVNRVGGEYPARTDAPANAVTLLSFAGAGGGATNELELDQVEILNSGGTVVASAVTNPSFETPSAATNPFFIPQPTGAGWIFSTGTGIVHNSQSNTRADAADGTQAAYLTGTSTIQQNLILPAGTYSVRFRASSLNGSRTIQASINGATVTGVITPATNAYGTYTSSTFTVAAPPTLGGLTTGSQAAQSIVAVTLPTGTASATAGVDFGYNFDTVVNTNDAGQGSLRQFTINANTLGGEASLAQSGSRVNTAGNTVALPAGQETSIFMIPNGATTAVPAGLSAYNAGTNPGLASQLTAGVANISLGSLLNLTGTSTATALYANNTIIDGTTQTANIGNSNAGTATNAAATTVGADGVALPALQRPEVELLSTAGGSMIAVDATNSTLRGFAIHGGTTRSIRLGQTSSATGYLLENLLVGTTATGVRPTSSISAYGIELMANAGVGTVQNSLVGFTNNTGLRVYNSASTTGTTQVLSNFFVSNGFTTGTGDGISFGEGTVGGVAAGVLAGAANVVGNSIVNTNGSGIHFEIGSTSSTTVTNNTITGAGDAGTGSTASAVEGSGIDYVQRTGALTSLTTQADVISKNIITASQNAGLVIGYGQQNVTISQNSFSGNGVAGTPASTLGIDLIGNANANQYFVGSTNATGAANYGNGDGPTVNDGNDPAAAANTLANRGTDYPILTTADLDGANNIIVRGFSRPGAVIEFYIRDTDAGNFGEGQTFIASRTEGNGTDDADATTGAYTGTVNGLSQGADAAANRFTFTIPISSLTVAQRNALVANGLTATATLSNSTSEFSGRAPVTTTIAGTIFDDVNYGGGSGRTYATANTSATGSGFASAAIGSVGTTVELYNSAGNIIATTTTTTGGAYSFPGVAAGTYTVRVVNSTVRSARNAAATGVIAVQTFRTNSGAADANRVGGEYPARQDAAANTGAQTLGALTAGTLAPESISTVTVATGTPTPVTGVDFGFNFDVVSNTNDVGQGSLRQFILNSNALPNTNLDQATASSGGPNPAAGVETSIFMIPDGSADAGLTAYNATTNPGLISQLSGATGGVGGTVAIITPNTATNGALPAVTDANTSINGLTQFQNIGNNNNVTLGTGGTVGVNGTALSQLDGPEVQLVGTPGTTSSEIGLDVRANSTTITGLAIYGFGNTGGTGTGNTTGGNIRVTSTTGGAALTGVSITGNVIGSGATAFADPGSTATRSTGNGIYLTVGGATTTSPFSVSITNNLIGYNGTGGIEAIVDGTGNGTTTGLIIAGNEIRGNAILNSSSDGVRLGYLGGFVRNNLFDSNRGPGIDITGTTATVGGATITNNTVNSNGLAGTGQTPGIRVDGSNTAITQNVISNNYGAGVLVRSTASTTRISQNSIFGNGANTTGSVATASGEVGIDLVSAADVTANANANNTGNAPYVTLNSATTTGGNGLVNYPVFTSATLQGTNLIVKGFAKSNASIELFLAQANNLSSPSATTGNNFGQGITYLTTLTAGATGGSSYGPADINGFPQGSDTNANAFTFTIPLTLAQQAQVLAGTKLTGTSTLSNATSEFSGVVNVNAAPVPNTLTNVDIPNTNPATALSPGLSGTVNGTANGAANSISTYNIVSVAGITSGSLTYNNGATTTVTAGTVITAAQLASLRYTPVSGFTGNVSFTYTVTDANGVTSTVNNSNGTITAGAATYTIPVVGVADVATTITPSPSPVNAGGTLTFTVTFTNAGPNPAAGYTRTLTLPAGLGTGVTITGATYNNADGTVTFTTPPTTLASGGNANVTVTIPNVPASFASITASTTTGTTTSQGADTGANSATSTVTVTPVADVYSNLTGPGSLSAGIQSGNYTVRFGNNGPSTAAGVTRVVTIPANTVSAVNAPGASVGGTPASGFTLTYPGGSFATGTFTDYTFTITPGLLTAGSDIAVNSNTTTTTSQNGATGNDPSSVTYTVGAIADVTTTLTAPATLLSGIQSGNYTVTYANNGPSTAAGVTRVVSIPANTVSAVNAPGATVGGSAAAGFTLTYPGGSFASGNSVSYTFTVTPATTAAGTNLTVTSTTGTTTLQGANLGPDSAPTTTPITPVADVTTTVTGPTQVIPGGTNTYSAVYTNNGPNTATGVTRVVQLPTGASLTTAQQNALPTGTTVNTTGTGASAVTTITFPSVSINNGASSTVSFAFTQSPTAGNGTLTSTVGVGTGISQGNNTAADAATLTINVAGAAFACNSAFYRVRDSGGVSILERLDRTTSGGTITYAGTTLYNTGVSLNALAYNYADNYLYAFGTSTNTLYRLSTTGAQSLGAQTGLSAGGYNAATSDLSGNIYLANGPSSTIARLVVSTLTTSTITLSQSVNFGDIAYNPLDGNLYGNRYYATSGANGIARINPSTGAVTVLSTPATAGNDVGSLFFDAAGSLYAATNQGNFVVFDTSTGVSTLVGTAGSASQSDGASCVFPTQSVDVALSAGTPVRVSPLAFDVTYTVNVKNTGVTNDTNLQINNFLNDGTSPTGAAFPGASSVTVVTAPAVTAGTALAVNTGFNGTTSSSLLAGTTSLASNATSTLTYTVRVTYPSVAVIPTTAQNNSVYASTAGTSPNAGYALVNGVAVPPSGVLAGDRSTNGTALPNTANGDTPSPTPVTFANPLAQNITNVTLNNTAPATVLNPNLSATPGLNGAGAAISSFTVNGPVSSGTLRYNGTPVTGTITVPVANIGLLTYQPVTGFTGNATFTFSATDANGGISNTATYTIPVQNLADVTTTLSGPTQLSTGVATGTYTVTYANVGTAAASTVTRTVALPAGATNIVAPGGTVTGTNIDFGNVTTLAAGASASFTFSFTAPTTAGPVTVVSNTSTTTPEGTNPAPNSSTINATVNAVADVAATITPIAASVAAGTTGTGFNVSFANNGATTPAAGVTRTVQLPAGLGTVSATNGGTYNNTTGVVTYTPTPTTIANGTPLTSQITFTAPASGPVTATANVATTSNEAGQTANNTQSASIAINPAFDLTTTIYGPGTVVQGNEVVLNVTTTNNGPSATTATQTVQLIGGLTNVFVSNGGTYNSANGAVTFPAIASLPNGQTVANTISFTAPTAGTALAPVATVTPNTAPAGETNIDNNTAYLNGAAASTNITINAPTTLLANVYTTVSATPQSVAAGSPVTVTVTQGNAGPTAASNVIERVQLLPGLTLTTTPSGATYNPTTGLLTLPTVGSQASGASTSYTIVFTAPANAGNNGQLLIGASVTTQTSETVLADNVASTVVTVVPTADVATFVSGPANASAGQQVTYTASFANNGQGTATSVVRTVQLPAGLGTVTILDAATGLAAGTYNSTTGLVTFTTLATQAAGTSSAYTLSFAAPATSFTVRSATSATTVDGVTANNASSVSTTVAGAADVAVAISGPATAVVGNPVTYYVTTTNNGPSTATGVATTLQLPANLSGVTVSNGGTYASGSGLVTFTAIGALNSGASVGDYVTFTMPSATGGQLAGVATATSTSTDPIAGNNSASVATSVAPVTSTIADVATTVSAPASITAGATLTVTATFTNNGPAAAINVAPTAQLPAGLAGVVVSNSGTYNPATGVVTWPIIASAPSAATATYTVDFPAPATGPVRATSAVSSQTSDNVPGNNSNSTTTTINTAYDAVTSLSGPASSLPGVTNTYTVTATNNGPSAAPLVQQTVTLPAGVTATNISNGGTQTGTTITWTALTNLAPGAANALSYTFDVTMPATGNLAVNASVSTGTGETNAGNNGATLTTTRANQPPVASNVVNSLQSPEGNTAGQLLISPLAATDADGSIFSYQLTSIPDATTQGTLYYNNGGTYTALTAANIVGGSTVVNLTSTQAGTLRFDPVSTFAGNVVFTYTATDNLTAVSNVAMYTIPVGLDNAAVYANTAPRGGASPYITGNIIAYVVDPNGANYNNAGTIYNTDGTLSTTGAPRNGLATSGTNAVLTPVSGPGSATPPSGNPTNTLPAGTSLNPTTGQIFVSDASQLPRVTVPTAYTVNITTTDIFGGVTTQPVTFSLGAYPLPVELTVFTAKAVKLDGVLSWTTALEKNNDHFDVERSLDGRTFTKIGMVQGQGSKATPTDYALTDANIGARASGTVYYRLKQVDVDGASSYSPVRTIAFTKAVTPVMSLYPNPAVGETTLDLSQVPGGTYTVSILDATGRVIMGLNVEGGMTQQVNLTEVASGTYTVLLRGTTADGTTLNLTKRLLKN